MSRTVQITLLCIVIVLLILVLIFGIARGDGWTFPGNGWHQRTGGPMETMESAQWDAEAVTGVDVELVSENLRIVRGSGENLTVEQKSDRQLEEKYIMRVAFENGVLSVRSGTYSDGMTWWGWNEPHPSTITITVPGDELESVWVSTVSGQAEHEDVPFDRGNFSTVSGGLTMQAPACRELEIHTTSGDVQVTDVSCRQLTMESVSGDMRVSGEVEDLSDLESVSGNVQFEGSAHRVDVETVSGDIYLDSGSFAEADADTTSGHVEARIRQDAPFGTIDIDSMSGDASIYLPAGSEVGLDMDTMSGEMESRDFDGRVFFGSGGDVQVKFDSASGNIRFFTL